MPDQPFYVLQGEIEYQSSDHPHYFRGRFATFDEAVVKCREIVATIYAILEEEVAAGSIWSYSELHSLHLVEVRPPTIHHDSLGSYPGFPPYSSYAECDRRAVDLSRRHRLPYFQPGARVRYVGSREKPWSGRAGNVVRSARPDGFPVSNNPRYELVWTRFDFDGEIVAFAAGDLYPQSDDTTSEAEVAQRLRFHHIGARLREQGVQ